MILKMKSSTEFLAISLSYVLYDWFSHDVTDIQTKKLSILLSFHFYEVLKYPNTFIYTNFWLERVIRFAIEDA